MEERYAVVRSEGGDLCFADDDLGLSRAVVRPSIGRPEVTFKHWWTEQ